MPFNSLFSWFIKKRVHQIELFMKYPGEVQQELFQRMIDEAALTRFGLEHGFSSVRKMKDFKAAVPVRKYEDFKPYIERLREGDQNVLWPSRLKWFAKSSGTTDDRSKYIPVSREALEECHYKGGKDLLALYCHQKPNAKLYNGKTLVVGGSSKINTFNEEGYTGDLSAIIIRNLPIWAELRRTPSLDIALMDNWEEKIEAMARATMNEDVSVLSGVPSWTLVLLHRILEIKGVNDIHEVWPNLELYMHGGVSFRPYREQFRRIMPQGLTNFVESYNASEGFFGIQDRLGADDMLLMLDYGILYEFMPLSEIDSPHPRTLSLEEVEVGESYALVISTNAGLWRYLVGDTVRFTSRYPFRIQVSGRTRHFLNAFGEELMVENADYAIQKACEHTGALVREYTAAPVYMDESARGAHEWLIEFERAPDDMHAFRTTLDMELRKVNSDYDAKRSHDLNLREPLVHALPSGTFYSWLKQKGKLGGQHKVPRLSNDRKYVEEVLNLMKQKA
jgi:hypothetical protein